MVERFGSSMECVLDICLPVLALRAGEVSNAGRETFLATNSDITIEAFVSHLDPAKVGLLGIPPLLHCSALRRTACASLVFLQAESCNDW
jgi:hypothetical protein